MLVEILWILFTLFMISIAAIIAKKFGVEFIIVLVGAAALMANVFAAKVIDFFGIYITAGTIIYSMSYFLTDMLSEFYGRKTAQRAIWTGMFVSIIYFISLLFVLHWPAAPFWTGGEAFNSTLNLSLRITIASLVFYLVPQLHDTWAYHFWRKVTKGKYLFVRNNMSTIVSQFIDTAGFIVIAFYGVFSWDVLIQMIFHVYLVKVSIAMLDTPYLYALKYYFKK